MVHLDHNISSLHDYLLRRRWIDAGEQIEAIEKPGEGNMNFTLRVRTNLRSFILKQSRDYVEKYPSVRAPRDRVQREAEFYTLINEQSDLAHWMPRLTNLDTVNNVIMLEDLGAAADYTFLYDQSGELEAVELRELIGFLTRLHSTITTETTSRFIANIEMRELNHEHIFVYPYMADNGMDLDTITPGLQRVANELKANGPLKDVIKEIGDLYLPADSTHSTQVLQGHSGPFPEGSSLLHGDYFPGSWLRTEDGIKIIDPEFCFFGPVEYEIGVLIAHLKLADQPEKINNLALELYGREIDFDSDLQRKFTGAEVLRRILGLAQLPLSMGLEKRLALIEDAVAQLVSEV